MPLPPELLALWLLFRFGGFLHGFYFKYGNCKSWAVLQLSSYSTEWRLTFSSETASRLLFSNYRGCCVLLLRRIYKFLAFSWSIWRVSTRWSAPVEKRYYEFVFFSSSMGAITVALKCCILIWSIVLNTSSTKSILIGASVIMSNPTDSLLRCTYSSMNAELEIISGFVSTNRTVSLCTLLLSGPSWSLDTRPELLCAICFWLYS